MNLLRKQILVDFSYFIENRAAGLTVYAGGAFGVGFWLAFGLEMIPKL